ncbi:gluconate 2-dehydrogenase subunit 3 family protein [Streptomyces sp. NPDC059679]|uniref:gluconate 2-dehydrogenase subunit 3 family protein n=1 Tax=Streptomyces sp. NPDC059679 TaxID=3346903 RepID=UPI00369CBE0D
MSRKGVLGQVSTWDTATAGVVLARLGPRPPLSFFTPAEEACAGPLLDLLLARRHDDPPIPVLPVIDARLAAREFEGWRFADMPEDDEAWRRSLATLDEETAVRHDGRSFGAVTHGDRHRLLRHVQDLGSHDWYGMPAGRVWTLWTRYACTAYYAHPYAWDEIGFGGPAYPRGYLRLGRGVREPWEAAPAPHRAEETDR